MACERVRHSRSSARRILCGVVFAGLAGLAALAGCQSTPPPNPASARARLEPLVEAWDRAQRHGGGCEERRAAETPILDCQRISLAISRLAIEFPRDPDVLLAHAVVEFGHGRRQEALNSLDVLRSVTPIHPEAAVLRARIAIDEGNLRFADRLLEEQRELAPDHPGLWEIRGAVRYLQGDHAEATRSLRVAQRLGAPSWRVDYHLGLVAEARSRPEEAASAYARCLDAAPDFAPATSRLRALAVARSTEAGGEPWR